MGSERWPVLFEPHPYTTTHHSPKALMLTGSRLLQSWAHVLQPSKLVGEPPEMRSRRNNSSTHRHCESKDACSCSGSLWPVGSRGQACIQPRLNELFILCPCTSVRIDCLAPDSRIMALFAISILAACDHERGHLVKNGPKKIAHRLLSLRCEERQQVDQRHPGKAKAWQTPARPP